MVVAGIGNSVHLFEGMLSEPSSKHQNNEPDDKEDAPEPVEHNEEHVPAASSFDSIQWTPEPEPVGPDEEHVPAASNLGSTHWTPELDVKASSNSWQEAAGNSWQQAGGNQRPMPPVTKITPGVAAASISGRRGHGDQRLTNAGFGPCDVRGQCY